MRLFRLGSVKAQKLTHAEKAQWIGMENRIPGFFLRQLMKVRAVDSNAKGAGTLRDAMNKEESIRYKFFLGSGCRDKEVTFAAWQDIDFNKGTLHIRRKEDVGFAPKTHESRTVPLPENLINLLKGRHKQPHHPR